MERALFIAGAVPFLILGFLHSVYTLADLRRPAKLVPKDPGLLEAMKRSSLRITGETTMWKAWVGFNLSHGVGVLFFGFVYFYLSVFYFDVLIGIPVLLYLAPVLATVYLCLSLTYWFRIPAIGSAVGAACFSMGAWLSVTGFHA